MRICKNFKAVRRKIIILVLPPRPLPVQATSIKLFISFNFIVLDLENVSFSFLFYFSLFFHFSFKFMGIRLKGVVRMGAEILPCNATRNSILQLWLFNPLNSSNIAEIFKWLFPSFFFLSRPTAWLVGQRSFHETGSGF